MPPWPRCACFFFSCAHSFGLVYDVQHAPRAALGVPVADLRVTRAPDKTSGGRAARSCLPLPYEQTYSRMKYIHCANRRPLERRRFLPRSRGLYAIGGRPYRTPRACCLHLCRTGTDVEVRRTPAPRAGCNNGYTPPTDVRPVPATRRRRGGRVLAAPPPAATRPHPTHARAPCLLFARSLPRRPPQWRGHARQRWRPPPHRRRAGGCRGGERPRASLAAMRYRGTPRRGAGGGRRLGGGGGTPGGRMAARRGGDRPAVPPPRSHASPTGVGADLATPRAAIQKARPRPVHQRRGCCRRRCRH